MCFKGKLQSKAFWSEYKRAFFAVSYQQQHKDIESIITVFQRILQVATTQIN